MKVTCGSFLGVINKNNFTVVVFVLHPHQLYDCTINVVIVFSNLLLCVLFRVFPEVLAHLGETASQEQG